MGSPNPSRVVGSLEREVVMTEREWLECGDWLALWRYSSDIKLLTVRKMRLFAAAACRRFSHRIVDQRSWRAVEVCERSADDGVKTDDELTSARDEAAGAARSLTGVFRIAAFSVCLLAYSDPGKVGRATEFAPLVHAYEALIAAGLIGSEMMLDDFEDELRQHPVFLGGMVDGKRIQADLLREVIGNPFYPRSFDLSDLTPTTLALAQAAYENRALPSGDLCQQRLAVLSDALEEAGGEDADLLRHLRSPGPHARGCWALDLILDKR